jgi:GAF domain-containing protein
MVERAGLAHDQDLGLAALEVLGLDADGDMVLAERLDLDLLLEAGVPALEVDGLEVRVERLVLPGPLASSRASPPLTTKSASLTGSPSARLGSCQSIALE